MKTYTVEGIAFEAPSDGVAVDSLGLNCWEVRLVGADPRAMSAWVDLVVKSREQIASIPGDPMQNLKMVYLGADRPAEKRVERRFGAQTLAGDLHPSDLPVPSLLEIYRFDLPDGGVAGLSFARARSFDAAAAEAFHAQIASTLRAAGR